ncbi:hypothetical protein B0J18DRAFT_129230 [Chaetomium sp. MPI-SDFR-AT-0129]|nr:hypothetical protein B0J18DRAFT_129230 [Chaetomium sp. MPI-SDFR-AT-0129]
MCLCCAVGLSEQCGDFLNSPIERGWPLKVRVSRKTETKGRVFVANTREKANGQNSKMQDKIVQRERKSRENGGGGSHARRDLLGQGFFCEGWFWSWCEALVVGRNWCVWCSQPPPKKPTTLDAPNLSYFPPSSSWYDARQPVIASKSLLRPEFLLLEVAFEKTLHFQVWTPFPFCFWLWVFFIENDSAVFGVRARRPPRRWPLTEWLQRIYCRASVSRLSWHAAGPRTRVAPEPKDPPWVCKVFDSSVTV